MAAIIDSYSESNADNGGTSAQQGQSFTGDGGVLNFSKFSMSKIGSPTGTAVVKIYAHSGTFGTSSVPTGSPLATSGTFDVSTLTTSSQLITFTFSGGEKITLINGTKYVVTLEISEYISSWPDYVVLDLDAFAPSHAGNYSYVSGENWTFGTWDLCFYVYKDAESSSLSPSASPSPSSSLSPSASKSGSQSSSASQSPSASTSASESPSASASESKSLSPSASTSASASASYSPSPSAVQPFFGLKIAKDGVDALITQEPYNFKFNSNYGTLKYFSKETVQVQFDANDGVGAGTATINHALGYYPFVEVFVRVYIGTPIGNYEYCPFAGSGAAVSYDATYKITTSDIVLYTQIAGLSASVWTFDFLVFIYKNNLNLS